MRSGGHIRWTTYYKLILYFGGLLRDITHGRIIHSMVLHIGLGRAWARHTLVSGRLCVCLVFVRLYITRCVGTMCVHAAWALCVCTLRGHYVCEYAILKHCGFQTFHNRNCTISIHACDNWSGRADVRMGLVITVCGCDALALKKNLEWRWLEQVTSR